MRRGGLMRRAALALGALALTVSTLLAHDLFVKLDRYFLRPGASVLVPILNGTFLASENAIEPRRVADLSLVSPGGRARLDPGSLRPQGDTTLLPLVLRGAGTYVVGLSVRPSEIELSGKDFTQYLREEAIRDVLADRARRGSAERSVRERYSKHVKAVFQVGRTRTGDYGVVLGYPAELVPLENPYGLGRGDTLPVRCLVDGEPVPGQPVLTGGQRPDGSRIPRRELRAGADGVVRVPLSARGRWYVKFIRMVPGSAGVDYESKWATLTFEVR